LTKGLSRWQRAWGRCACLRAVDRYVVTLAGPTQPRRQQPTRARPTEESRFKRQVIAEGVETPAHSESLLQLDFELVQGYGIARPMPAADLPRWVANFESPAQSR